MMILIIFVLTALACLDLLYELNEAHKRIEKLQYICKHAYKEGFCDACVQMEELREDEG